MTSCRPRCRRSKFGLPASTAVDTTAFVETTPFNRYYIQALENAVPFPVNPNGSGFQALFVQEAEALWAGVQTPEEFAAKLDAESSAILDPQ